VDTTLSSLIGPVLELKVTEFDLVPRTARQRDDGSFSVRYAADYSEQVTDDRLLRRLTLQPVEVTTEGTRSTGGVSLILEQTTELQEDQSGTE
jgi:hypothetical protein